jgi:hypothetical protein
MVNTISSFLYTNRCSLFDLVCEDSESASAAGECLLAALRLDDDAANNSTFESSFVRQLVQFCTTQRKGADVSSSLALLQPRLLQSLELIAVQLIHEMLLSARLDAIAGDTQRQLNAAVTD